MHIIDFVFHVFFWTRPTLPLNIYTYGLEKNMQYINSIVVDTIFFMYLS